MADMPGRLRRRHLQLGNFRRSIGFAQERPQIEPAMALHHIVHRLVIAQILELRPLARIAVPGQLDAIEIGIVQIEREMRAMVVIPVDLPTVFQQTLEGHRQIAPGRIVDGEVIEPGRTALGRLATGALPGIEGDVMVIPARAQKRRGAHVVEQIEPERIAIERDRPIEIGDLQMHMADMGSGWDGLVGQGSRPFRQ